MNLTYIVPRVVRHFLPESLTRFLLLRSLIIKPGLETVDHAAAVARYAAVLADPHEGLRDKRILVFGYGGRFEIGVGLLDAGAAFVALCDRFAPPDDAHNAKLLPAHGAYLTTEAGRARPRAERMALIGADVRMLDMDATDGGFDLVVSSSVYEHVDDAEGVTQALSRLTNANGQHIHFVDLRDHFFKFPFEMLCYSERTWRRWLNPGSNHNRLRLWDYRRIFEANFADVEIAALGSDERAFRRIQTRIRPEFVSGNPAEDAVTLIRITARLPRR